MRVRVLSSKNEIGEASSAETVVHVAFRPSERDIFNLIQRCPNLRGLQLPRSYMKTLSESAKAILAIRDIVLIEGDVWGHRKDVSDYFIIDKKTQYRICTLALEGLSPDEIAEKLKIRLKISPDMIRFIFKEKRASCKKMVHEYQKTMGKI